MRLEAAVLPPPEVQEHLLAAVRTVPLVESQLSLVPQSQVYLRLAPFGHVTKGDAQRLHSTVARAVVEHPVARLRFAGGTALEPIGDDSVWAQLEGDVDQVAALGRATLDAALEAGFAVDRRISRRLVRLGRITEHATVEFLQAVVDLLEGYHGPEWSCEELTLLRVAEESLGRPQRQVEVWQQVRLAAPQRSLHG